MRGAKWPGDWKYDCQRCGFTFPSSKVKKEWTGLYVCHKCWESKHPQLMIKVREETARPDYVSRDSITNYVQVCDVSSSSCYSGLAQSGCARSGNQALSFAMLKDLFKNGHGSL